MFTIIKPKTYSDSRGWFRETYQCQHMESLGIYSSFVQENQSLSYQAGTVRGLHYQAPPYAQSKLISVLAGSIYDVIIDIRRNSATYGHWTAYTLTVESGEQLYVPSGFAHGFCTLEPNTRIQYKVDHVYHPASEGGISWCDRDLNIPWPVSMAQAIVSDRDAALPTWNNFISPF